MIPIWPKVPLKTIYKGFYDGPHATPTEADEGAIFLGIKNVTEAGRLDLSEIRYIAEADLEKWTKRVTPQKDDIVFSYEATLHRYARIPEGFRGCLGRRMALIRVNPEIANVDFVFCYFLGPVWRCEVEKNILSGATVDRIPLTNVPDFEIYLPPLVVQQKIAAILSAYDDLIENNLKRIKLLEEMAQITYEEWFVRMKFPGHEITPMDSETGLPTGWKRILLEQACDVSGGGTPSTEIDDYWKGGDIAWFSPTDLSKNNSLVLLDSSQKITQKGLQKSSAKLMQPNSFMMTSRATIGLFGLIDKPFCTNQGFINVTPKSNFHKHFLLFNFKLRVPEFLNYASGATFLEISKSKFKKLKIDWPTSDLLEKWDEVSTPIIQELTNLSKQNQLLKEARNILLPRLMTGMIDVEHLDHFVGADLSAHANAIEPCG